MSKETPIETTVTTKRLEIQVKEVKMPDGKNFLSYNTFNNKNEKVDVRFVKDATAKAPKTACFVTVLVSDMNLSKKYRYPRLYIQDIQTIEPYVRGASAKDDDDLPF